MASQRFPSSPRRGSDGAAAGAAAIVLGTTCFAKTAAAALAAAAGYLRFMSSESDFGAVDTKSAPAPTTNPTAAAVDEGAHTRAHI
jgi:hypothetical protein